MSTATAISGSTRAGSLWFQRIPYSSAPSATAVRAMVGSRVIRPITSAASAWTSALIRSALPRGTPSTPLCSQRARNESPAASDQTIVDSRLTGIPSIAARSPRSAAARIAKPVRVAPRNQATNAIAAGATIAATRSLAFSTTPSTSKRQSRGTEIRSAANSRPHSRGVTIASATSSDVTPIVATVSTIRDARRKRRMTATSTAAPSTSDAIPPTASPTQYDHPQNTMIPAPSATGAEPSSAWAKFTTRLAR